ncbi:receptor-like protein 14 [Quercus suber]|uniref:Receptor-like protein 14 n=1 Tax=Quercus suber TaxID=58331 RepID=A0AAW0LG60_QUESU
MKEGVSQNFSMGWPLVKSLLWALLLFVQIHEHRACIEEERTGLLELKAFLKSHTIYTKPLLPTWAYETKEYFIFILINTIYRNNVNVES